MYQGILHGLRAHFCTMALYHRTVDESVKVFRIQSTAFPG